MTTLNTVLNKDGETTTTLSLRGITKVFGSTIVLDGVDLDLVPGNVHALLGENGAGKSTLIKILAGIYSCDIGSVYLGGQQVNPGDVTIPVSFIHQDLGLDPAMSIAENISLVGRYPRRYGLISWKEVNRTALRSLEVLNLNLAPTKIVGTLSVVERSLVAIARALSMGARFVVLDEPTATLPTQQVNRLFDVIKSLSDQKVGFLYVTHRIDEVFQICDSVSVLRDGHTVLFGALEQFSKKDLVDAIVGHVLKDEEAPQALSFPTDSAPILRVENLVIFSTGPVDMSVYKGEILGLFGLVDGGQVDVGRALVGVMSPDGGDMVLKGVLYKPRSAADSINRGVVGFVAGDRIQESIAPGLSVQENLYLNPKAQGHSTVIPISHKDERKRADLALKRFDIRPHDPAKSIELLSGGNQQKVAVARWIEADVNLLVLEDPTAGVDVGSKVQIHELLKQLTEKGASVVVISSDAEEVTALCSRVLVFNHGSIIGQIEPPELNISAIISMAAGSV